MSDWLDGNRLLIPRRFGKCCWRRADQSACLQTDARGHPVGDVGDGNLHQCSDSPGFQEDPVCACQRRLAMPIEPLTCAAAIGRGSRGSIAARDRTSFGDAGDARRFSTTPQGELGGWTVAVGPRLFQLQSLEHADFQQYSYFGAGRQTPGPQTLQASLGRIVLGEDSSDVVRPKERSRRHRRPRDPLQARRSAARGTCCRPGGCSRPASRSSR